MSDNKIAKVVVSAAVYSIDKPYDYGIPENLSDKIVPGMRVLVPFGRGNRKTEGLVISVSDKSEYGKVKSIVSCIDDEPVITSSQLKMALWMRDRFFCTVYDAIHAMLPAGMWLKDGKKKIGDKILKFASLIISGEEAMELSERKRLSAPKQAEILRLLSGIGEASVAEICYFTGASHQTVKALERLGAVEITEREVFRTPEYRSDNSFSEIILNDEQEKVFSGLRESIEKSKAEAALLFGVTGSGKTSIYIRLIDEVLYAGKTAIMLVPEISLTPQFVSIFAGYFGDKIAVLHSSLSTGERYDAWKRIRSGNVRVVIGTRSAVFAPCENLGLIIMDEEQEYTYKSENTPRYHTREIAKYRCFKSNALLLMGSATPSVESMYKAQIGDYKLYTLEHRYNERDLPDVIITDMKRELSAGNGTSISRALKEEIEKNLDRGEQTILFINRRGASNFVLCGECGYTFKCESCSVSPTYHAANNRLMCHYCGYSEKVPERCPECGGKLIFEGTGTQKVEAELKEFFPDIKILRMDTDTVSHTGSHEKILSEFTKKKIPILVGTQMVAKGLDIKNVTLVGVISADQSLYVNDFRAHERTFSLITQVVGRSGRGEKTGRAVIQTFTPQNEVITLASKQDYMGFFEREIELRKLSSTPPVQDLLSVTAVGEDETAVLKGITKLRKSFENYFDGKAGIEVLGPVPAAVTKVNNKYRYRLSLSCKNTKEIREVVSHVLRQFALDGSNRDVSAYADADPHEI